MTTDTTSAPIGAHTFNEFSAMQEDSAVLPGLKPVGYWPPTPGFDGYLLGRIAAGDAWAIKERERMYRLPWPRASTSALSDQDLERVVAYLEDDSHYRRSWGGSSTCRLCGITNGSFDLEDGRHIWPSGLVHYVRDHKVGLPAEFVDHILNGDHAPIITSATGWCAVRERYDAQDYLKYPPSKILYSSAEEVSAHLAKCYDTIGSLWDYWADRVECIVSNGRISSITATGERVLALAADPDRCR